MKRKVLDEIAKVIAAQCAAASAVENEEQGMVKDNPEMQKLITQISALEASNREMKVVLEAGEREAEVIRRAEALLNAGLNEKDLENRASFLFFMDKDTFEKYVDLLKVQLDSITGKVSAALSIERAEKITNTKGGEEAGAEKKVEVAEIKNEETPTKETETTVTPTKPANTEEPKKEPDKPSDVKPDTKEVPKVEVPKVETPKVETPKVEVPRVETPKVETPKEEPVTVNLDKIEPVDQKLNLENQKDSKQPSLTDKMADIVQRFLKDRDKRWEKLALKK